MLSYTSSVKNYMAICSICGKHPNKISWSRHQKGSSGASGTWALRAQITKRLQHPNLHAFKNSKYCTKCLRAVKTLFNATQAAKQPKITPAVV